jgi:hypothetical protein
MSTIPRSPFHGIAPRPQRRLGENPYRIGTVEHAVWQDAYDSTIASEDARRRGETYRAVEAFVHRGEPEPDPAPRIDPHVAAAAAIIAAGRRRRGEAVDDVPRDTSGQRLDPSSVAAQIIAAGRKARGET